MYNYVIFENNCTTITDTYDIIKMVMIIYDHSEVIGDDFYLCTLRSCLICTNTKTEYRVKIKTLHEQLRSANMDKLSHP